MTLWRLERQWEGTQISTVNMMYNLGENGGRISYWVVFILLIEREYEETKVWKTHVR
jgi:hypothetical protein